MGVDQTVIITVVIVLGRLGRREPGGGDHSAFTSFALALSRGVAAETIGGEGRGQLVTHGGNS